MTSADITDAELRRLFNTVDNDNSGDVSIDELASFVWGVDEVDVVVAYDEAEAARTPPGGRVADPKRREEGGARAARGQGALPQT